MEQTEIKNIFGDLPQNFDVEFFQNILESKNFTLERIISKGHSSPKDFWYDQEKNEFIILLSGSAILSFDDGRNFILKSGDYLIIPAHQKHRVDKTDLKNKTFWLALHY